MRPVYGVDITENKHNTGTNAAPFIARKLSELSGKQLESHAEEAEELKTSSELPKGLTILKLVFGFGALVMLLGLLKGLAKTDIEQAYRNAPWVFYTIGICAVGWLVLTVIEKSRKKQVLGTEQATRTGEELEQAARMAREELRVPQNAVETDILAFHYKLKKGEPVPKPIGFMPTPYVQVPVDLFREGDSLMIADLESVAEFPIAEMKGIRTVNKSILLTDWNKKTGFREGEYKQYKLVPNQYGFGAKPYHILEIEHGGELYGIWFPCYELPVFERLTGLKAE